MRPPEPDRDPPRGRPPFLDELRRRKVVRVALVYLAGAFAALEASEIVVERLGLPDWTVTALLVAAIAGFPLAVVLAWVFDLTSEGIQRTVAAGPAVESGARQSWMTAGSLAAIAAAILLAVGAGWFAGRGATHAAAVAESSDGYVNSIAVLPFDNFGGAPQDTYFGDGLAEELLNFLARVDGLKVAARTSSFGFRGWEGDIRLVGDSLGVATVLEGSVRRSGEDVRVTAQLIRSADGFHIWSNTYDDRLTEVFAVQERIARAIADTLRVQLSPEDSIRGSPRSVEVADLYLLGRDRFARREAGPLRDAIRYFEAAIEREPDYAPAHAGLALAWAVRPWYDSVSSSEAARRVRGAATRAIELDDGLSEPYQALCQSLAFHEWRWEEAAAACDSAVDRAPNSATAHQWRAELLSTVGRLEEARESYETALALDPLSAVAFSSAANGALRRSDRAVARTLSEKAVEFDPELCVGQAVRLIVLLLDGSAAEAARAGADLGLPPELVPSVLAAGQGADALGAARASVATLYSEDRPEEASLGAILHAIAGDRAATLAALELALDVRQANLPLVHGLPVFDFVRDDPRFAAIVEGMGL
jgi:serine/threonine-protein kinase